MNQIFVIAWLVCQAHLTPRHEDALGIMVPDAWESGYEKCATIVPAVDAMWKQVNDREEADLKAKNIEAIDKAAAVLAASK